MHYALKAAGRGAAGMLAVLALTAAPAQAAARHHDHHPGRYVTAELTAASAAARARPAVPLRRPLSATAPFTRDRVVTGPGVPHITHPPAGGQWFTDITAVFGGVAYVSSESGREVIRYDLRTHELLPPLTGPPGHEFTGVGGAAHFDFSTSGPQDLQLTGHGARRVLWASNGDSTVLRFAIPSGRFLGAVSTGGELRADEMASDGKTVLVGNTEEAFLTLISVRGARVIRHVTIPGAVTIQKPAWDPRTRRYYVAVPATAARPGGEVAVLDRAGNLRRTFAVGNCGPSGLAVNTRGGTLALGCQPGSPSLIVSTSGLVVSRLPAVSGVDEVWSDPAGWFDFGNFTGAGCQVVAWSGLPLGNIPADGPGFHACASSAGRWLLPGSSGIAVWQRSAARAQLTAAARPATASGSETGTSPVTGRRCTSYWQWKADTWGGWTEVRWTANSCGFRIQDRSKCEGIYNNTYETYSGIVKGTYIWDRAGCDSFTDALHHGAKRYETGSGWTGYQTYWNG